ncbi:hypothetical protein [Acinetobacter sp. ANC 4648]|uniref:hypothetical protein n=1 Tax=Acinetobacter sp. ANC 4648 TaxID=1977875 RepID=UPI000A3305D1|nr:hypothetical protein [Acinetobacter sp. ANC 4648]OTG81518.1 hypothetical protein B9T27_09535 [Acinetobacter sp. ANC 4648]
MNGLTIEQIDELNIFDKFINSGGFEAAIQQQLQSEITNCSAKESCEIGDTDSCTDNLSHLTDHCTDIRNHISPLTEVIER